MRTGNWKAAGLILLVLVPVGLGACGSGSDTTTTTPVRPAVSAATADRLAKLSDRIASDLDAGDICHAAHAADDLRSAVEASDLPATLRPGVDAAAARLVDQVNCPPPPPPPAPEPEPAPPEEKKPEKDEHGNQDKQGHGGDENSNSGHSKNGGFVPPGKAKLKGEPK